MVISSDAEVEKLFQNASELLKNCEIDEAIKIFTEIVDKHPESVEVYKMRAFAYILANDFDKALEDLSKGLTILNTNPLLYTLQGVALLGKRKAKKAIKILTKAIKIDDKSIEAYEFRGAAYLSQKKINKALSDTTKALELIEEGYSYNLRKIIDFPTTDFPLILQALCYLSNKNPELAEPIIDKILAKDNNSIVANLTKIQIILENLKFLEKNRSEESKDEKEDLESASKEEKLKQISDQLYELTTKVIETLENETALKIKLKFLDLENPLVAGSFLLKVHPDSVKYLESCTISIDNEKMLKLYNSPFVNAIYAQSRTWNIYEQLLDFYAYRGLYFLKNISEYQKAFDNFKKAFVLKETYNIEAYTDFYLYMGICYIGLINEKAEEWESKEFLNASLELNAMYQFRRMMEGRNFY